MKKITLFGRQISVLLVIGILMAVFASAALVTYLSNTKEMTLEVQSPMVMKFDGEEYTATAVKDFGIVYGGENINYKVWSKNLADVDIDSYPVMMIISDDDWVGQELASVDFTDGNGGPFPILDMLYVVEDSGNLVKFTDGGWIVSNLKELKLVFDNTGTGVAQKYTHTSGVESWNEITITTSQGIAPGDYSVKLCHLDDLQGDCQ